MNKFEIEQMYMQINNGISHPLANKNSHEKKIIMDALEYISKNYPDGVIIFKNEQLRNFCY